ncbi:retropepsin-like aspartic protease family protein [Methylomagnum sp.]
MNAITKIFGKRALGALIVCLALGQAVTHAAYADTDEPESTAAPSMALRTGTDGHYYTDGSINDQDVSFLVDTGASAVVIPEPLAAELGLEKRRQIRMASASDVYDAYETIIPELSVGPIRLLNVLGNINPKATGTQVLLGMSALKGMQLIQENGKAVLRGAGAGNGAGLGSASGNGDLAIKIRVRDCIGAAKVIDRNALECMKGLKPSSEVKAKEIGGSTASSTNPGQLLAAQ